MRFVPTALAFSAVLFAAEVPLAQGDRDFALSALHSTRKVFLDSVSGLTAAQWNFKPAPDRWSIAECAEHIALSEDFITAGLKKAMNTPVILEQRMPQAEARAKDEKIISTIADRSHKVQAPEAIRPARHFQTPQEAVDHFKQSRAALIDYMINTPDDLRGRLIENPVFGKIDVYEGYLYLTAHTQRHTAQILEVKAAPNFPR